MKEHPILFSGPMVRAILEGRKTQTRRVMKPQPRFDPPKVQEVWKCPYGGPSNQLWVRETHAVLSAGYTDGTGMDIRYKATDPDYPYGWTPSIHMPRWASRLTLEVTDVRVERVREISEEDALAEGSFLGRCPCQEMQRKPKTTVEAAFRQTGCHIHGEEFATLWNSINAKRGYGWDENPWVWVISFRRIS